MTTRWLVNGAAAQCLLVFLRGASASATMSGAGSLQ
jgi:hypothetical protein